MAGKRIKVRIAFTIEVDEDDWRLNYGPNVPIREDVRNYYVNAVQQSVPVVEGFAEVIK